jgi:hypothetical protein
MGVAIWNQLNLLDYLHRWCAESERVSWVYHMTLALADALIVNKRPVGAGVFDVPHLVAL